MLIPFRKSNKWGFCNTQKEIIIDCIFDKVRPFQRSVAVVRIGNKYGLIDCVGNVIINIENERVEIDQFHNIVWVNFKGKFSLFLITGELLLLNFCESYSFLYDSYYLVNKEGYEFIIDKWGNIFLDMKVEKIWPCGGDLFIICVEKFGLYNLYSKKILSCDFDDLKKLDDLNFGVFNGSKWALYNYSSDNLSSFKFDDLFEFNNGVGIASIDDKYFLINCAGDFFLNIFFDEIEYLVFGFYKYLKNEKWGIINVLGHNVVANKYDSIKNFTSDTFIIEKQGRQGLISCSGKVIIDPIFREIGKITDGLALATIEGFRQSIFGITNGNFGYINKFGETIIPFQFDFCRNFENGIGLVNSGGKFSIVSESYVNGYWAFIGSNGRLLSDFKYSKVGNNYEGIYTVVQNSKWGFVNNNGEEIIPPQYYYCTNFENSIALVENHKNLTFYIDSSGNEYWM